MGTRAKVNFKIVRGKTFTYVLRRMAEPFIYVPITAITATAPARITVTGHDIPNGWPVAVVSVKGMKEINAPSKPPKLAEYVKATVVDANMVELNSINASEYTPYASGGYLQYYTPAVLAGYTARMTIKDKVGGTEILSLTTENGRIVLDDVAKTVRLVVDDETTAALAKKRFVYDMELVATVGGEVVDFSYGSVDVADEVTT